ncbi:MAG: hypothetical protein AB1489_01960 [Acidobacteriota bacterium]
MLIVSYVGDHSRDSARQLWKLLPKEYRQQAIFYTDDWEAYKGVIPIARHRVCEKVLAIPTVLLSFVSIILLSQM